MPFFLDDGPLFNIVSRLNVPDYWQGTVSFFFYRPSAFTLWELHNALFNPHDATLLHLLSIVLWGFSGAGMAWITRRISGSWLAGHIAGIAFVIFPFAYQALIMVTGQFHIILVFCAVTTIALTFKFIDSEKPNFLLLIVLLIIAVIGAFSHENSALIVPIMGMLIILVYGWRKLFTARVLRVMIPLTIIELIYVFLWFTVEKGESVGAVQSVDTILWSFAYFMQGMIYPFIAAVKFVIQGQWETLPILALVTGILLVFLLIVRDRQINKIAILCLIWYMVGLVPSMLLLDEPYIGGSPRLLLYSIPAFSIFWGVTLAHLFTHKRIWGKMIAIGVMILGVGVSALFLYREAYWGLLLDNYYEELDRIMIDRPMDADTRDSVIINAPDYLIPLVPEHHFFPRGSEGVIFMLDELSIEQQIWVNTGYEPNKVRTVANYERLDDPGFSLQPHPPAVGSDELIDTVKSAEFIYMTEFYGTSFYPVYVGSPDTDGENTPLVSFEDAIYLTEADLIYDATLQRAIVRLRWQVEEARPARAFVHVFCDGQLVGQSDAFAWGNTYPFERWTAGETQAEYRHIFLSQPYTPGNCFQLVGIYRLSDGLRLEATRIADGSRYENDVVPVDFLRNDNSPYPYLEE